MAPEHGTKERIVQSARRLIYTRSYANVGVAEICAEAGVRKGSFYHFFPSKQELALAMLDDYLAEQSTAFNVLAINGSLSAMARVSAIADMIADGQERIFRETGHVPGCPFGNVSSELSTQDEKVRRHIEKIFTGFERRFEKLLNEAVKEGEIQPLNAKATAKAMLAFMEGVLLSAKTRNDPALVRQIAPAIIQLRIS